MYERELEENDATLVAFIDYYCGKIRRFFPLYAPFADRMEIVKAEHLPGMTTADKLKLLSDMMTVASSGAGRVDFEKKYGGGQFGRLNGKTVYPDQVVWIDLSLTGLRRRERREEL